jgi:hypothetical protein
VTHEEARSLLPAYALGALDEHVEALEGHLKRCADCKAQLSMYLETAAELGDAVSVIMPPASLRQEVLAHLLERRTERPGLLRGLLDRFMPPAWILATASLALLIAVAGLIAWTVIQQQQLQATRSQLALSERGLALLTSTETTVERLAPVAEPQSQAHGHWYHRPGIATQVLVVEFMPALPQGESYYGWFRLADGSWQWAGPFSLDSSGYGRLILLGSDGSDVRGVVVTRQTAATSQPASQVVLEWPSP